MSATSTETGAATAAVLGPNSLLRKRKPVAARTRTVVITPTKGHGISRAQGRTSGKRRVAAAPFACQFSRSARASPALWDRNVGSVSRHLATIELRDRGMAGSWLETGAARSRLRFR